MFLTDSTSDNSGHTATLRSAKIRQSRNSYVRKPLSEISRSALNLRWRAKYEIMWWASCILDKESHIYLYNICVLIFSQCLMIVLVGLLSWSFLFWLFNLVWCFYYSWRIMVQEMVHEFKKYSERKAQ